MNAKLFAFGLLVLGIESVGIAWSVIHGHTIAVLVFTLMAAGAFRILGRIYAD